jgi:acyl-CoA thioesterase-1
MRRAPLGLLTALVTAGCGARDRQAGAAADTTAAGRRAPVILFLGTSLTAGLGVEPEEAYPALIERKLDSAGFQLRVVNAGLSGETSAGGLRRIEWLLSQPIGVLVLELGANDALRGQAIGETRNNLQEIVRRTKAAHPDAAIVIAGMEAPPNMGRLYTNEFRRIFREVAEQSQAALIPFLLDGVAGVPGLNQPDGIHPTAEGHAIMADNVWKVLAPVLSRRREQVSAAPVRTADTGTPRN